MLTQRENHSFSRYHAGLILWCAIAAGASDADRVQQLVDIIKSGPSLYRTPKPLPAYARFNAQGGIPAVSTDDGLAAIQTKPARRHQSCRLRRQSQGRLGANGHRGFPQAEYLAVVTTCRQLPPEWVSLTTAVQTYVISSKKQVSSVRRRSWTII